MYLNEYIEILIDIDNGGQWLYRYGDENDWGRVLNHLPPKYRPNIRLKRDMEETPPPIHTATFYPNIGVHHYWH